MTDIVIPEPNATVVYCAIDNCDWAHLEPHLNVDPGALANVFGPGIFAAVAHAQQAQRIEDALDAHYRTHTVVDFLRTMASLRHELADHRARAEQATLLIDRHVAHYNTVGAIHPHGGLHAIRAALTDPAETPSGAT